MPNPPPGLSQQQFNNALRRLEGVVGKQWVFSSNEDVALYRDSYSPLWGETEERLASAAVAPASVEEVKAIVDIANDYRLPLYPISTGKNLTYGGAAPVYSGSVVLDLKRMNRILDVNERDKTCLVEPGVSYFDLYRHFRQHKFKLWVDTADPGWGGVMGNAMDRGGGYTGADFRDHFDAHCGMEVVLGTGEVVRTGMGANEKTKAWQLFKYGLGPWLDGIFSQSNYGIVTKMGFWLMEEPETAMYVTVSVPKYGDIVPLIDILSSLSFSTIIPSNSMVISPIMSAFIDPEVVRLRYKGAGEREWMHYAGRHGGPFWVAHFCFYGPRKVIDSHWEHSKERFSVIPGVQFDEVESHTFPLTDAQVEAVEAKVRFGIPSLNIFNSRNAPGERPNEGHLDFSPIIAPHGEELLAYAHVTGKVFAEMNMAPPNVIGFIFHPRAMTVFIGVPTYRNAAENRRSRALFERLIRTCADNGWTLYRVHAHYQPLVMGTYSYNNGALHRLHETLKDAIDPNGIIAPGRYDIWPKHLRGKNV